MGSDQLLEKWKEDLKSLFEERKTAGSPEEKDAEIESHLDIAEDVILENFLREYKKRLWSLSK
jgi:hypothetical protein